MYYLRWCRSCLPRPKHRNQGSTWHKPSWCHQACNRVENQRLQQKFLIYWTKAKHFSTSSL